MHPIQRDHINILKASEEEILGAGSEQSEPDGVKTNLKEVSNLLINHQSIIFVMFFS